MEPAMNPGRCILVLAVVLVLACSARTDEVPEKYRETIRKGLEWLVKQQHKAGHWDVQAGQYPTPMTALAGMALLMEGTTVREGKHAKNIRRAAAWLMEESQQNANR